MCGADKKRKKSIKMERIITSLLETDMYKFSMGQAIYHQFSDYKTTWSFKCRNTDVFFTKEMVDEIKRQIQLYCDLRFTEEELEYLHNIKWIKAVEENTQTTLFKLWGKMGTARQIIFGTGMEQIIMENYVKEQEQFVHWLNDGENIRVFSVKKQDMEQYLEKLEKE